MQSFQKFTFIERNCELFSLFFFSINFFLFCVGQLFNSGLLSFLEFVLFFFSFSIKLTFIPQYTNNNMYEQRSDSCHIHGSCVNFSVYAMSCSHVIQCTIDCSWPVICLYYYNADQMKNVQFSEEIK